DWTRWRRATQPRALRKRPQKHLPRKWVLRRRPRPVLHALLRRQLRVRGIDGRERLRLRHLRRAAALLGDKLIQLRERVGRVVDVPRGLAADKDWLNIEHGRGVSGLYDTVRLAQRGAVFGIGREHLCESDVRAIAGEDALRVLGSEPGEFRFVDAVPRPVSDDLLANSDDAVRLDDRAQLLGTLGFQFLNRF